MLCVASGFLCGLYLLCVVWSLLLFVVCCLSFADSCSLCVVLVVCGCALVCDVEPSCVSLVVARCCVLLCVDRCSLFVVSGLMLSICLLNGILFVGCCLMSVACCSLLLVGDWLLGVWSLLVLLLFGSVGLQATCSLFIVCRWLCDVLCSLRVVCCLLFWCGLFGVWRLVFLVLGLQLVCYFLWVVWSSWLLVCLLFVVCRVIFVGCGCC